MSPRPVIAIRSVKTGEEREVSSRLTALGYSLRWSSDGRSMLVGMAADPKIGLGTYVINLQGDVVASMRANTGDWCCDGQSIVTARNREKWESLFVRNLETGQYQEIYSGPVGPFIAVSRDGRWVAFSALDINTAAGPGKPSATLKIMAVPGGEARDLLRLQYPKAFGSMAWTPAGRRLLFVRTDQEDRKTVEIWTIPTEGGEPQGTGLTLSPMSQISVHPDGRRVAYNVMKSKWETWAIESFLPSLKKAR